MSTYTSKLGALLRHRQYLAGEAERGFLVARGDLVGAEVRLENLTKKREHLLDDLARLGGKGIDMNRIGGYYQYLEKNRQEIEDQKKVVGQVETVCEVKRDLLLNAVKDKKIIENIEAVRKNQFMTELYRKEGGVQDEIAIRQTRRTQ